VPTSGRDLGGMFRLGVAPHVGEIRIAGRTRPVHARPAPRIDVALAAHEAHRAAERVARQHVDALDRGGLARVAWRDDEPLTTRLRRGDRRGEHTAHTADTAVEGQLADEHHPARALLIDALARDEHTDGDRQVEGAAGLAQVRRRQVDRDPLLRPLLPRRDDRRAHALA
jgi:hypothetical protein